MTLSPGALIAVTGGTGAIGRRVVQDLLIGGFRVRLLGRGGGRDARLEHAPVDLGTDEAIPSQALVGCDAVVHLAAHIPARQDDPASAALCFQTNVFGTLKLLRAMESAGIERLIQTTSANAYAAGLDAPGESAPMYPSERAPFYLASKVAQDIFGSYWDERRAFCVTTLRLSSVYGAGIETALFTKFAKSLGAGAQIRLANGGSFGADFVDVADVSAAVSSFLANGTGGPFNIASGERTTVRQAAEILVGLTGCGEDRLIVEPETEPEIGFPRMDISKAREFGFAPTDLRKGLAELVDWVAASS